MGLAEEHPEALQDVVAARLALVGAETQHFKGPALVGGEVAPPRRRHGRQVGEEGHQSRAQPVRPQRGLPDGGEDAGLRIGVQPRRPCVDGAEQLGNGSAIALQLEMNVAETHVVGMTDELVPAPAEHDIVLEAVAQAGLGDAPARLKIVDQAEEALMQVRIDVVMMRSHDGPEEYPAVARGGVGGQPVRAEGHPPRRGDSTRVSDLDLGQQHRRGYTRSRRYSRSALALGRHRVLVN